MTKIDDSGEKYVQLIFLDISGAFDNAWWPMILVKAKQCGVSPNIYRMLVSYFTGRQVGLIAGHRALWKVPTMGCPQGSVLGPTLWNLLLDDLLKSSMPEGVSVFAYADDITIVIEAPSRAAIEARASKILHTASEWGRRNRLQFSTTKSQTMTIKGKFQRAPIIKMNGASIPNVTEARLLGVTLDVARSYVPHASFSGERAARCFGKVSRVSASSWGLRYKTLRLLYMGTFVAIVSYAAAVWYRRTSLFAVQSTLLRTQRPALVLMTKAYRSTSTAALPVLAGVLPADLQVVHAGKVEEEGLARLAPEERKRRKEEINEEVLNTWQERWDRSANGRELFCFFPSVHDRLKEKWVEPDYVISQILTGHGCFRKRLSDMQLNDSPTCMCGYSEETRDHVLWECDLYTQDREEMMNSIEHTSIGPAYHVSLINTPKNFAALKRFAYAWHSQRKQQQ